MFRFERTLREILYEVRRIRQLLETQQNAQLHFEGDNMATVTSIQIGKTAQAILEEFDAAGLLVPNIGPLTATSDNPFVASIDSSTGVVTGVAVGSANITVTDSGNGLAASAPISVADVADVAVSATLHFEA